MRCYSRKQAHQPHSKQVHPTRLWPIYRMDLLEPSVSTSNSHVYQNGSEKHSCPLGPSRGHL